MQGETKPYSLGRRPSWPVERKAYQDIGFLSED